MLAKLVDYLKKCDDAYYNSSTPIISDDTYDALVETLRRVSPDHEYLKKVGAKAKSDKVGRLIPMGTLSKYHTDEDVLKWLESEGGDFLLSPKYDGFAVELVYDSGRLIAASTRGDGYVGEDVLRAAMRIRSIPLQLSPSVKGIVIVRGEAIIPKKNHDKIKELGYTAMRNAVPGIVRSCREDALGYVDYVAYEFIDGKEDRSFQRYYYSNNFIVEDYRVFEASEFNYMKIRRDDLRHINDYPYELDGVVIKTKEIKEDDLLNPSHMIAWKYKSNRETTILRDMEYQMGVTGYFTPIGVFDIVEFQGAKLSRASLGNMTRLANEFEGLTIGSLIEVSRRGDIIPYIESMVIADYAGELVGNLTVCPHCGHTLAYYEKEPHCVNKSCPEMLRLQISQFARSIGIKGIGDKLIRGLIDLGYLKTITDIYTMEPESILELPRQGQSSVDKWRELQNKKLSAAELLTCYPFLNLGRKVWDTLLTRLSYKEILDSTEEDLSNFKGIGESKKSDIYNQVKENVKELIWLGELHGLL